MPIFTGACLTRSPSTKNTTSTGFGASLPFLSFAASIVFVLALALALVLPELAAPFVTPGGQFVSVLFFGRRVVTLAIGTDSTLVRERVSISAVTDMPGRNGSFSLMRIL